MLKLLMLFLVAHHMSGIVSRSTGVGIAGVSLPGICNILACFFFIISLPFIFRRNNSLNHSFTKCIAPYIILSTISIMSTMSGSSVKPLFQFASNTGSLVSIYYLSHFFFKNLSNFTDKLIYILKAIFIFASLAGFYYSIKYGFNYNAARINVHNNNFLFFEYPHSFGIFISCITPLFMYFIDHKRINPHWYYAILIFIPLALYFSGAKIAVLLYIISITVSFIYRQDKDVIRRTFSYLIIGACLVLFFRSSVYYSLKEVFSISLVDYNKAYYSLNSFHTRLLVWTYMIQTIFSNNAHWFGMGWRAWTNIYLAQSGYISSQSDYVVRFFDIGIVGVIGYLLYKFLIVFYLLKNRVVSNGFGSYVAIGIICSLYIGGFSEAADGYSTTSWLIPLLFAINQKVTDDIAKAQAHYKQNI